MSTQYDAIGASYDELKKLPAAQLEVYNFKKAMEPYAKGAKALDLACGTGHHAKTALDLGAALVVGVDISPAMVEVARSSLTSDRATFLLGDCSKPTNFDGGPFDLVLGSWLLNYAPSAKEMSAMYRTVAMNLKEGGRLLAVTPHPTNGPKSHQDRGVIARPVKRGNITTFVKDEVEDGVVIHLVGITPSGKIEFDGYHLKKDVYERCAREGGMKGALLWKPVELPAGDIADSWDTYLEIPHFGILDVAKS